MKRVSLKKLKQDLSTWVELAHNGSAIEVMKYNRPFAMIVPWRGSDLRVGPQVGKVQIKPCLKNATRGKWAKYLDEDRES